MTGFDPGPGWREVDVDIVPAPGAEVVSWYEATDGGPLRRWIREEPTREALDRAFASGVESVLDQIAAEPWARDVDLSKWARMFGVSS